MEKTLERFLKWKTYLNFYNNWNNSLWSLELENRSDFEDSGKKSLSESSEISSLEDSADFK